MIGRVPLGIISLSLLISDPIYAAIPKCIENMEKSLPGKVLTPEQMAINQSCLYELRIQSAASDLAVHIAENDQKIFGKKAFRSSLDRSTSDGLKISEVPPFDPDAKIVAIYTKGRRLFADLKMPDGSSRQVSDGTKLEGEGIVKVSASTVTITNDNGVTTPLKFDIENDPSPTLQTTQYGSFSPPPGAIAPQ